MHYNLLTRIMRYNGLGHLLEKPDAVCSGKKLLADTVLATDMSLHFKIMEDFKQSLGGESIDEGRKITLLCQALIKCADISNPVCCDPPDESALAQFDGVESTPCCLATLGRSTLGRMDSAGISGNAFAAPFYRMPCKG